MSNDKQKQTSKFYRQSDIEALTGFGVTTIWRWCKTGRFPQPIKLGGSKFSRKVWPRKAVDDYLADPSVWIEQNQAQSQSS